MAEAGWARNAVRIGVFEFRRSVRAMWREKFRLAFLIPGVLLPTLVCALFFVVGHDAISGIEAHPIPDSGRGMLALSWLFIVFMIGQRTVSARKRIEAEPLVLTTVSSRTVAGGLLVGELLRVLAYVGLPLFVLTGGFALLFGSIVSLLAVPAAMLLYVGTAVVVGQLCGYAVAWLVETSRFVARHKMVLGTVAVLIGMGGYFVFITAGPYVGIDGSVFAWLPTGWVVDLAVLGTPIVGSTLHTVGGVVAGATIGAVGAVVIERETGALWFSEPVSVEGDDTDSEAHPSNESRDALAGAVWPLVVPRLLGQPTRRVAEWVLLRTRRDPNRLLFVLLPVFVLPSSLFGAGTAFGSVTALLAPLCAVGLPWLAGSLFALNSLGDEGTVLPVTLTAVSGRQYVRGLVLPGLLFGLPIGVVVTTVAGVVSPYTLAEQASLVLVCAYLTCVSVTVTPAVGMALPRFSAISVGQSQDVRPPRMGAIAVHMALTVLPGGLLAALVVAPSAARTGIASLLGYLPSLLLGLLTSDGGFLTGPASWFARLGTELQAIDLGLFRIGAGVVLVVGGAVVAVLLYRNAVHRFQRYAPP